MLVLGIVLCYLLGLSVMLLITNRYTLAEAIGYSFLIGMGLETVLLFLLDIAGIGYSAGILAGLSVVAVAAINGLNYKKLLVYKNDWQLPKFSLQQVNPTAILIFAFIAFLYYASTVKNLYWPVLEHDGIGSFDKLAKAMAAEGKLKISLFQYNLEGAGGVYPPLFHGSLAYAYIFGAITPKIIISLFFLSLLAVFYSIVRQYTGAIAAMLFTLLLMLTPEMYAHASLGLGNLPTTAYVGPAVLATLVWLHRRNTKYFWLGAILMAFVLWIRSDTIVFTVALMLLLAIDFLRNKNFKQVLTFAAIAIAPFIIWTLYLKLRIHAAQSARFDTGIGYNSERVGLMKSYIDAYLFGGQYKRNDGGQLYGLTFPFFFLMLVITLVTTIAQILMKKAEATVRFFRLDLNTLLFFFISFGVYALVFYLINEKTQNAPLDSLMDSSFKRGMFCFVPIALFFTATCAPMAWLWEKIEAFRTKV